MTDLFSQQGINFQASSMASTHPTTTPAAIEAPKVDLENAPANQTLPVGSQNSVNSQTSAPPLSPSNNAGSTGAVTAGGAPPQPSADSGGVDLFAQQGIKAEDVQPLSGAAFTQGATIPPRDPNVPPAAASEFNGLDSSGKPAVDPVTYAQNQMAQDAKMGSTLFTPAEMQSFKNNPIDWAEVSKRVSDYDEGKLDPIKTKVLNNEPLTSAELDQVKTWAKDTTEVNLRGLSWGGKTAYVGLQIPQWMTQVIGNGDAGADTGNGEIASLMPPPYTAQYGEKQLNAISAITDKGQLILDNADHSPATAAMQTFAHVSPSALTNPFAGETTDDPLTAARLGIPYKAATNGLMEADAESYQTAWKTLQSLADKSTWESSWGHVSDETKAAAVKAHAAGAGFRETYEPAMAEAVNDSPVGGAFRLLGGIPVLAEIGTFINKVGIPEAQKVLGLRPEESQALLIALGGAHGIGKFSKEFGKATYTTYYHIDNPIAVAGKDLAPTITSSLYEAWKGMQSSATLSKMFTPQGWNQMVRDLGEAAIRQALNVPKEDSGDQPSGMYERIIGSLVPDKDTAMVEGGLISVTGGAHDSNATTKTLLITKGATDAEAAETTNNMSSLEKDAFVSDNLPLPQSSTPTNFGEVHADTSEPAVGKPASENGDTDKNIVVGGMREDNAANPALIPDKNSGFNEAWKGGKLYAAWVDNTAPIELLGKLARTRGATILDSQLSPAQISLVKMTGALTEEQWTTRTTTWDAEGNKVTTGKGLKQIGDDFDNIMYDSEPDREVRWKDMSAFRKAMTFIEDKTKGYSKVSDKDFNESQETLVRLADKYGDKTKWFETFAKEYRDWDNRILHNLVTSGLKTQAWYDDLVGKREWYSSTARVVESEYADDIKEADKAFSQGFGRTRKGLGADVNPKNIGALKQRKGSTLEVQDPVISSMRNSAIIMKRAALNKLRNDVAEFANYYPDKVKVERPRIIRQKVDHSYDPKLRTKLEQLAEFLGIKVERVRQGESVGGKKNNLGAFDPNNDTIFMRQGSTEGTLTHEVGHGLDKKLGLQKQLLSDPEMKAELEKLSEDRLRSEVKLQQTPEGKTEFAEKFEQNPKSYIDYVKKPAEIIANFFDAWVNKPDETRAVAPKATAAFEKMIDSDPQLSMLRDVAPSTQRAVETIQRELLDYQGPKDSVPFYDKGQLKFLHMDKDTALAFNGLDQFQTAMTNNFFKMVGKAQARTLQFGATNNPYFMARHFTRSVTVGAINNPGIGIADFPRYYGIEIPKAIASIIGRDDAYHDWKASSGGLRAFLDTSDKNLIKLKSEMMDKADWSQFLKPSNWAEMVKRFAADESEKGIGGLLKPYSMVKELADYTAREAAYNTLKGKGYSDLEAGFLSLEGSGNYTRHGWAGKMVNDYVPFFNDSIQGADRFVRAIKNDPVGTSIKAVALITLPQLIISGYYLFAADDETRNEYLNLSDFRRNTSTNIKIAGQWVPIPRPFAPGFFFGAIPEQMMIHYSGIAHAELKNFWLRLIGDSIHSLSPATDYTNVMPPAVKAVIESQTNYSFYRQMSLFHGDLNKVAPENQSNARTSETAKMLGKTFGVSPVDIDNTVYDMAAHIGVYATQLSDYAINTAKRLQGQQVNQKPTRGSDNPIYGPLMQQAPIGTASESFQEFQEHEKDLSQQQNRLKESTGADKSNFIKANREDLALYPTINTTNTKVMHEEHEIRVITENPQLSGDDKAQQIAQHQRNIELLVEGANKRYHNVKDKK